MENNIKEIEDNPKIITRFEPLIWLAFIALTAVLVRRQKSPESKGILILLKKNNN